MSSLTHRYFRGLFEMRKFSLSLKSKCSDFLNICVTTFKVLYINIFLQINLTYIMFLIPYLIGVLRCTYA